MAFPTHAVSTELDAVNQILSSVGQAPVTTLDLQNPEVSIILNTLEEVNKQCQSEGWSCNTEYQVKLQPDAVTKHIRYPVNALQIDANEEKHYNNYDVVKRGARLYDRKNHTYDFNESLYVDITYLLDFTDLPGSLQAYITAKAARMCAVKMVGDSEMYGLLQEQELLTRAAALEYDMNQGDHSYFGYNDGNKLLNNYQPFRALMR